MENVLSFMTNYLQMVSSLVHGDTFNQQESIFFLAVCKCSRLCVNLPLGTFRLHIPNLNPMLEHLMKVVLKSYSGNNYAIVLQTMRLLVKILKEAQFFAYCKLIISCSHDFENATTSQSKRRNLLQVK